MVALSQALVWSKVPVSILKGGRCRLSFVWQFDFLTEEMNCY